MLKVGITDSPPAIHMHNTWLTQKFYVTLSNIYILPSVVEMCIKQQILFEKMMCPIWYSLLLILICLIRKCQWKVWGLKYSVVLVIFVCLYLIWHNMCGEAQFVTGWCWMQVSYQTVLRYLNSLLLDGAGCSWAIRRFWGILILRSSFKTPCQFSSYRFFGGICCSLFSILIV